MHWLRLTALNPTTTTSEAASTIQQKYMYTHPCSKDWEALGKNTLSRSSQTQSPMLSSLRGTFHCRYVQKVKQELDRIESIGVISKVDEPIERCAGMVADPKESSTLCICVGLKPLNESALREVHPLPEVDETLAQLSGARIISKLDANSGFWQIPLAKQSRLLTRYGDFK